MTVKHSFIPSNKLSIITKGINSFRRVGYHHTKRLAGPASIRSLQVFFNKGKIQFSESESAGGVCTAGGAGDSTMSITVEEEGFLDNTFSRCETRKIVIRSDRPL